jgi:hypothetical protein
VTEQKTAGATSIKNVDLSNSYLCHYVYDILFLADPACYTKIMINTCLESDRVNLVSAMGKIIVHALSTYWMDVIPEYFPSQV